MWFPFFISLELRWSALSKKLTEVVNLFDSFPELYFVNCL